MIPNTKAKQIIIESLAFENVNSQCKGIIRPLKVRSAAMENGFETVNELHFLASYGKRLVCA